MRMSRTLSFYLVREVVQYTLLGLAAITVVMVTRSLVRVLDELIGAGFLLEDLLTVLRLLGTMLTVYALPVSFLFGVLLAIGRMAADVETTAMRACGIGVLGLTLPIALVGVLISVFTFRLTLEVEPAARREMSTAIARMLVRGASVTPGEFNVVGNHTLFVDERAGARGLRGIVISDRSEPERPFVIFAESGEMSLDEESGELTLRLEQGDIHVELRAGEDDRYQRVAFDRFEYTIDMTSALTPIPFPRAREMTIDQLREVLARIESGNPGRLREEPPFYAVNLHRRYATPLAPPLFAMVGVPLGMRRRRGARSYGVLLCAVLAFLYYGLGSAGEFLATQGGVEPVVAIWLPNLVFAAVGAVLLARARHGS